MKTKATSQARRFAYLRTSTADRQEQSPAAQLAAIRKAFGEPTRVFEDRGVSGGTELKARPALSELLAHMKPGDELLVAKRDRLARDSYLSAWLRKDARVRRYTIRSADGASDDTTAEGRLLATVIDAFGQFELDLIRARTRAALAAKRARGERAGTVPFGFTLLRDGKNLRADPKQQKVVASIMRRHRAGAAMRRIARDLTANGIPGPAGGAWNALTIKNVIAREQAGDYAGARRRA